LGVTGGASLGAVLAYYWGLSAALPIALPAGGLAGALAAAASVLAVAARAGTGSALILAGIGVAAIASSLVAMALSLAPSPFALAEITIWLLGSLEDRSWRDVWLATPAVAAGLALLLPLGERLDALALGEETAASLGVSLGATVARAAFGTALAVGGGAAVAGGVGFVGLIVPNLLRAAIGERPGRLLFPCAFGGAALLLAADLAVRLAPLRQELRLGVLTALIGAPVLLVVALREARAP
ncbi:MAG: iron ABC transporter permease, partial [Elioraea sp.]|nr:iron ABC transporter permease [Elioraea sp.]